ncbi:ArsR/SmtB family transcription factor [Oryzibacter oryziterrae]|uniref:ArsR/SmtB family transcription factor n=1 Tax=Oryzibacter oryziterrae TaxID=2766474 RepID=UPI001F00FB4E|nr:metalloregulator ArsR/SmtB family transcription factor [Oryzibacter oryziterrae]
MPDLDRTSADYCVSRLKAIADTTRWSVMVLLNGRAMTAGALQAAIGIDPTLLSHHLKILKQSGLAIGRRHGREVTYSLAEGVRLDNGQAGFDLGCCSILFAESLS